ncbi:uncharacterized protein LOC131157128 isoform X2 [Malania oleifera]|uniref:uncharacterized protein LOC131157128 isoform X2 n=1 Tax=Malania oleifera TaxID=397392 RepID=UPI0025AE2856|nr:uncharacterized protein LOC131157128 isoform X2 [Malania oleifera]XP_057967018.1 uncharacterized protein LOC131157128 isoform X2 [Malania oleifera]XP_057967019.1 uncharacterized protein LOC131157128 isoform X2 [Malania oleifera]
MKGGLIFHSNSHVLPTVPLFNSTRISNSKALHKRWRICAALEIRVCVNRTCRRQGSMETLETLSGIAPPSVTVKSCGCLGRCGAGPNLVALPAGVIVGHCGTAAQAAEIMVDLCDGGGAGAMDSSSNSLAALALRKRAEDELHKGNLSEAELLLSQAIDRKPHGGIHFIYKHRSSVRLAMGNYSGALEDAKEALALAPQYPEIRISKLQEKLTAAHA